MIKLKALSKASLALACLLCFSAYNTPAYAVGDYNNHTWGNDVDYYKGVIDEGGYADGSTLTDWHWMIAGNPNNGTDTLDDGFCFMYDGGNYGGTPYAIYNAIDPSQCAFYNNTNYLNIEWYSFTDLNLIAQPDPAPIAIYQDQQAYVGVVDDETNIFGTGSSYWSGCFATGSGSTWADNQNGGGDCPIINNDYNQINWGYMQQSLTQISAIDTALKNAGLETYGYTYSWLVKNADANFESTNGADGQDTLYVTLSIKDNNGNTVYEKEFDYSYWIDSWTTFSGEENFDTPFDLKSLDSVMLQVTGQDVGGWDGYYGPEFNNPNVKLKYRPIIEDNTEQLLFEQMCMNDPLYDMNCPGYQTAMMDQMAAIGAADLTGGTQNALADALNNGGTDAFGNDLTQLEDPTGQADALAQATGSPANDGQDNGQDIGTTEPIVETEATGVPDPVEEAQEQAIAEATPDPVEEAQEQAIAEATPDPVEAAQEATAQATTSTPGTGLNATQLSALDAASNVANSAVASATGAAQTSTGIGLSETGGVSSALTAVDTTGTLSADGSVAAGTFTTDSDSVVDSDDPNSAMQANNTGSVSNVTITDASTTGATVDGTFGGMDTAGANAGSFDSNSADTTQSISTTNIAGTTDNNMTGSDDSSQNDMNTGMSTQDTNTGMPQGNTQLADSTGAIQDGNPLADGSAVETTDITGEDALAVSNEATIQVAALNDPTNPINQIINDITANLITRAVDDANETAEESAEDSVESQNEKEDALVVEAQSGSDDEDAKAALLGYNPKIRAYQQEQVYKGGDIYANQGMYEDQKTYDNPNSRLFNGASDALHRDMVRQQYDR